MSGDSRNRFNWITKEARHAGDDKCAFTESSGGGIGIQSSCSRWMRRKADKYIDRGGEEIRPRMFFSQIMDQGGIAITAAKK